jgi:L-lysine 2,3-aminomutase
MMPRETAVENRDLQETTWQLEMRRAIRNPAELCRRLELSGGWLEHALAADGDFPVFVPEPFLRRMKIGDPNDPLLRQVLPMADELKEVAGFQMDPVGDLAASRFPGLIQKYHGRALLIVTGACAIHCRY